MLQLSLVCPVGSVAVSRPARARSTSHRVCRATSASGTPATSRTTGPTSPPGVSRQCGEQVIDAGDRGFGDRACFQATDRRAARDRHPQPLIGVGREASKHRERPSGMRSAPTREKRRRRGCRAIRETRSGRPGRSSRGSRVAHQPEDRCGSAIDRAILRWRRPPGPPSAGQLGGRATRRADRSSGGNAGL